MIWELVLFIGGFGSGILAFQQYSKWQSSREFDKAIKRQPSIPEIPPPRPSYNSIQAPKEAIPSIEPDFEVIRSTPSGFCDKCGILYRNHKYDMRYLDDRSRPYLHIRCDGMRIKL